MFGEQSEHIASYLWTKANYVISENQFSSILIESDLNLKD